VGRKVDVDDLIDTQSVAQILGLAHRNTVSEYQARYEDMPRPVVDLGGGRSKLWLRDEVERWAAAPRQRAGDRGGARRVNARS
jgi:glutathione-regulated potassium-efflux system ancillary protein KefG